MAQICHCCGSGIGQQQQLVIRPVAWEPPYATDAALKRQKDQKKKKLHVSLPDIIHFMSWPNPLSKN